MHQDGRSGSGPRAGQHLRGGGPHREPGVHEVRRQVRDGVLGPHRQLLGAEGLPLLHPVLEVVEDLTVVQVRGVDDMSCLAEPIGEDLHSGPQPER